MRWLCGGGRAAAGTLVLLSCSLWGGRMTSSGGCTVLHCGGERLVR